MRLRLVLLVLLLLLIVPPVFVVLSLRGGHRELPGSVHPTPVPSAAMFNRRQRQQAAVGRGVRQILFGDLHVHTTFSIDAFQLSLPLVQGEGAHPPADACDFARFCSGLDFFAITDHAESLTPRRWMETKHSIRQCNAVAGRPDNPDLVGFVGWEWSQAGPVPEEHYGHKNVILHHLDDAQLPERPIASTGNFARALRYGFLDDGQTLWQRMRIPLLDYPNRQRYLDMGVFLEENRAVPDCPLGVDTRHLPPDCFEVAETPQELFEKLAQGKWDSIVIPHGTTWGLYTPPGSTFDKQLTPAQHDPERQTLFEVYSGHGNSEEYRAWKAVDRDAQGRPVCPAPTRDYEPCCWRAGEIIRSRCGTASADECERRVETARQNYLAAGAAGRGTIPSAEVEEWKDCGQCRDCFNPAFSYRPGGSAQYVLALSNFDQPGPPRRFRFGFLASSDNHKARPGTGYKEYGRRAMTEATGTRSRAWRDRVMPKHEAKPESIAIDPRNPGPTLVWADGERAASFFMTGGLVAVHSEGRGRDAIWAALKRREVYGTSGDRILLWFDLANGPEGPLPMGAEVSLAETPRFVARAVGTLAQRPGCPDWVAHELPVERLQRLCRGECYNPGDDRRLITRIEVVRVRPQQRAGEPVGPLIEDPWRRFECPPDRAGCRVEFEDSDFVSGGRDVAYYVRAIEEPSPAVNAKGLRCEYDASGQCVRVHPCYGDFRTPLDDDCLAMNEERAWSSPIYVNHAEE